jgi:hypothetical protein
MTVERLLRGIAGTMVLASIALAQVHHRNWLFLTGFVGFNLLQSAFTNWCPMTWVLQKAGCRHEGASPSAEAVPSK